MKMISQSGLLSPGGRCWSFDERGNGYARGEGTGVLIIKRVDDAIRDGDTIRAVIRNTGSNQDGRTPSITQPSMDSQLNLIKRTYRLANLDMEPTRFFEAHGTGTGVGDPIEANAIGSAFRNYRSPLDPLYIGAVKANVGHLEGASGVAGIIKALLVLEHGVIPPIAGLERLNPRIDADQLGLHVRSLTLHPYSTFTSLFTSPKTHIQSMFFYGWPFRLKRRRANPERNITGPFSLLSFSLAPCSVPQSFICRAFPSSHIAPQSLNVESRKEISNVR